MGYWASRWHVEPEELTSAEFNTAYLQAMQREGSAGTGIFGLRIMWPSVATAVKRLADASGKKLPFRAAIEEQFGPTAYIYLRRTDKLHQAVSLVRAQQSGVWHLHPDGTIFEGTDTPAAVVYDRKLLANTVDDLQRQDNAWNVLFGEQHIEPLSLEYEWITADPRAALAKVLSAIGRDPAVAGSARIPTAKMADGISREWIARFQRGE